MKKYSTVKQEYKSAYRQARRGRFISGIVSHYAGVSYRNRQRNLRGWVNELRHMDWLIMRCTKTTLKIKEEMGIGDEVPN